MIRSDADICRPLASPGDMVGVRAAAVMAIRPGDVVRHGLVRHAVALVCLALAGSAAAGPFSASLSESEFAARLPPSSLQDRWASLSVEQRRAILTQLGAGRRDSGAVIRAARRFGDVGDGRRIIGGRMTIELRARVPDGATASFGTGFEQRRATVSPGEVSDPERGPELRPVSGAGLPAPQRDVATPAGDGAADGGDPAP